MSLTHKKISSKQDSTDPTIIQPSDWNDNHSSDSSGLIYGNGNGDLGSTGASNFLNYLRRKSNGSTKEEYEFTPTNEVKSTDFNFLQVLTQGLTANVANQITLTPVPLGVNGNDFKHVVRINNENLMIQGGTAISGSPSGTIIITPTSNHASGSNIGSATAGIQEAVNYLGDFGGSISIPPGYHRTWAAITIIYSGVVIHGAGNNCIILPSNATASVFVFEGENAQGGQIYRCQVYSLYILASVLEGGSEKTGGTAISLSRCSTGSIRDTWIEGFPVGYALYTCSNIVLDRIYASSIRSNTGIGIIVDGGQDIIIKGGAFTGKAPSPPNPPGSNPYCGIQVLATGGLWISNVDCFQSGHGLVLSPTNGHGVLNVFITDCAFDSGAGHGLLISPSTPGSTVLSVFINNSWLTGNMGSGLFIDPQGGAKVSGITINGIRILRNYKDGVGITGGVGTNNIRIGAGSVISGNNTALAIHQGTLQNITVVGTVATVSTSYLNLAEVGKSFILSGAAVDPDLNGTYTVTGTPTTNTFTFNIANVSPGTYTEDSIKIQFTTTYGGIAFGTNITDWSIQNSFIGEFDLEANSHNTQIYISSGCDKFIISGNHFTQGYNVIISDNTAGKNRIIKDNIGIDYEYKAITAAASVVVNYYSMFTLTGNTTILNFTGSMSANRRIIIVKADTGTVTFGSGGNIGGTNTLTQFGVIEFWCDGSTWYKI